MNIKQPQRTLLDYLTVLLKYKVFILVVVFITAWVAGIMCLMMPNIYRSEATIIPRPREGDSSKNTSALLGLVGIAGEIVSFGARGDVDKFEIVLKSRHLASRVIMKYDLMPDLFEDEWDPLKKNWEKDPAPTFQDAYRLLMSRLTVSRDRQTDILTIKFDHEDPRFAKIMVVNYLTELSESLREKTLKEASENQQFIKEQLDQASDVLLKEKLWILLSKEIEKEIFLRAQRYHSFIVLDPPVAPDPNKKVKPSRTLICFLSATVAFLLAILLSFIFEYIENLEEREDEERLGNLRRYLKLRPMKA